MPRFMRIETAALTAALLLLQCLAGCNRVDTHSEYVQQCLQNARKSAAQQLRQPDELDSVTRLLLAPEQSQVANLIDATDILLAAGKEQEAWRTTGAIAACGGPVAAAYLRRFYAERTVTRHVEPVPPYAIPSENTWGFLDDMQFAGWDRSTATAGAVRYTAFLDPGESPFDIRIAAEFVGGGGIQSVLYTGLVDTAYYAWHWAPLDDMPQLPLALTLANGQLSLRHHSKKQFLDPRSSTLKNAGAHMIVVSAIELSALKADTDGDGLTDVFEGILRTDSSAVDSDQDGLRDAEDPHPLSDYSAMGYKERGIARALSFLQATKGHWQNLAREDVAGLPQKYCFIEGGNFADVAWAPHESVFGICGNRFPKLKPTVYQLWLVDFAALKTANANPGFDSPEQISQRFAEQEAANAPAYVAEDRIIFVLDYQERLGSDMVVLVEVEGEIYPALSTMMSVS